MSGGASGGSRWLPGGWRWPANFRVRVRPGSEAIEYHLYRRGVGAAFCEAMDLMDARLGRVDGFEAHVSLLPPEFPVGCSYSPTDDELRDASEGGMFPMVCVEVYLAATDALTALRWMRAYEETALWPLYASHPLLEAVLHVSLAGVPGELMEADAAERIRRAEGLPPHVDPFDGEPDEGP